MQAGTDVRSDNDPSRSQATRAMSAGGGAARTRLVDWLLIQLERRCPPFTACWRPSRTCWGGGTPGWFGATRTAARRRVHRTFTPAGRLKSLAHRISKHCLLARRIGSRLNLFLVHLEPAEAPADELYRHDGEGARLVIEGEMSSPRCRSWKLKHGDARFRKPSPPRFTAILSDSSGRGSG